MFEEAEYHQLDVRERAELSELLEEWRARKAARRIFLALCGLSAAIVLAAIILPAALGAMAEEGTIPAAEQPVSP